MAIYQGNKKLAYLYNVDNSVYAVPIGTILSYASTTPPNGFLVCDGSEVSKTTYTDLYKVIGDTYGTVTDTSKFKLPDLRETIPVGIGENTTQDITNHDEYTLGQFKDDNVNTLVYADNNKNYPLIIESSSSGKSNSGMSIGVAKSTTTKSFLVGTGNKSSTHGKQLGVNYIIKALKVGDMYAEEVGALIDDSSVSADKVWSSEKVDNEKIGTDDVYEALKLQNISTDSIKDFLLTNTKVGTYVVKPTVTGMPIDNAWWMLTVEKAFSNNTSYKVTASRLSISSAMYYMIYNAADNNYYKGWTKIAVTNVEDVPATGVDLNQDSATGVVGGAIEYTVKNGMCQIYISALDSNNINTVLLSNFVFPTPILDGANYPIVEMDVGDTRNKVLGSAYIDEGKLYAELETQSTLGYCSITYICAES